MYMINKRATDTQSLWAGGFPDEWKIEEMKLLNKKGDTYDIQNYRPITIICLFAKELER